MIKKKAYATPEIYFSLIDMSVDIVTVSGDGPEPGEPVLPDPGEGDLWG